MNLKNISTNTWIRTIVLIIALINQILQMKGFETLPFTDEEVSDLITTIFTVIAALSAWWKNNSFTSVAQTADIYIYETKKSIL